MPDLCPAPKVRKNRTKYVMESNLFGVLDNVVEVAVRSTRVLDRFISRTLDCGRSFTGEERPPSGQTAPKRATRN